MFSFSYDTVDRIVLEKATHKIKGIQVIVEKLLVPNDRRALLSVLVNEITFHVASLQETLSLRT